VVRTGTAFDTLSSALLVDASPASILDIIVDPSISGWATIGSFTLSLIRNVPRTADMVGAVVGNFDGASVASVVGLTVGLGVGALLGAADGAEDSEDCAHPSTPPPHTQQAVLAVYSNLT